MLDAEETMRLKRVSDKKEFESRAQSAFQDEIKAAAARATEREEWRQDMHARKQGEKEEKIKREQLKKEEFLKEEKKKEFIEEQQKNMDALHALAIKKHMEERSKSIDKQHADRRRDVGQAASHEEQVIDMDLDRTLISIGREMRKKEDKLSADLERRRNILESSYGHAKKLLAQEEKRAASPDPMSREEMNLGHERMQLESEHKRQLMRLDKEEESERLQLKQERESLEREAKALALQKSLKAKTNHARLVREAQKKHDTAMEWIGLNDPEAEGK